MLAPLLFTCTHQTSSRAPAAPHPQRHGGHRHHGPSRSGVVVHNGTATLTPCKPSELAGKAAAASGLAHVHVHTQMLRIFYLCQVSDLQEKVLFLESSSAHKGGYEWTKSPPTGARMLTHRSREASAMSRPAPTPLLPGERSEQPPFSGSCL